MARKKIGMNRAAADAVAVLGQQIRSARHSRGWTVAQLAEVTGMSPTTITAIEKGRGSTAIGSVFNVAAVTGVALFGVEDPSELIRLRREGEERIALIPSRVDKPRTVKDDDLDF